MGVIRQVPGALLTVLVPHNPPVVTCDLPISPYAVRHAPSCLLLPAVAPSCLLLLTVALHHMLCIALIAIVRVSCLGPRSSHHIAWSPLISALPYLSLAPVLLLEAHNGHKLIVIVRCTTAAS